MAATKTILIAGGSGLIGSRLVEYLPSDYKIHILSRSKKPDIGRVRYFLWDTNKATIDSAAWQDVSVVINLAGAGIADKRWTDSRKKILVDSRVNSAETIMSAMQAVGKRLPLYIGASAIGYYGDTGDEKRVETDAAGQGFLAEVTKKWEEAQNELLYLFDRSVLLRIGIVLSTKGGALKEMLKPAVAGVYGYFGNGEAYYSWVHIDDICKMILAVITDSKYEGIYNATAPAPITIKELITATKQAKGGFGIVMPVPTLALKMVLGEMTQMLTDSMRVIPKRLIDASYQFEYEEPVMAIKDILERKV